MKRATCMLGTLALLLGGVGQLRADLIVNGSFESETANGVGGFAPNDWTLTGNAANFWTGGELSGRGGISAFSGSWFASFSNYPSGSPSNESPSGNSGLQQTVSTTPGQEYTLGFWYTYNAHEASTEIMATWNNTVLMDNVYTGSSNGWQYASFTVTGSGSDTVAFSGYDASGWNGIDDVSLDLVNAPEPSSLTLLGIGVVGLSGYGWRRRRQST